MKNGYISSGHRERLRNRMLADMDALQDYEVLEVMLFSAIPRRDTKTIAKKLLSEFGSVLAVLNAKQDELISVDGVGRHVAGVIKTYCCVMHAALKDNLYHKPIEIHSSAALLDFCKQEISILDHEMCYIFLMNSKNMLIKYLKHSSGNVTGSSIYVGNIVKDSLKFGASSVILAHNHPSGDPAPSKQDIMITFRVKDALEIVNIDLLDHIVIGRDSAYSIMMEKYI